MKEIIFNCIFPIVGAIGGIITIIGLPSIFLKVNLKDETLFGDEAVDRFKEIESKLSSNSAYNHYKHGGGNIKTPKLEIRRIFYDPQTMGTEWKGIKKTVRYFYEENGEKWIKVWRFK